MKKFAFVIVCLFLLNLPQFAQNISDENSTHKIAFYSKYSFYDERNGIKKLVEAERLLDDCDFSLQPLLDKIREAEKDLKSVSLSTEQRKEKETKYETAKDNLKIHNDKRIENHEKRKKIILQSILNEITNAINIIEKENNLVLIDLDELTENGLILNFDESLDLSKSLILFINNNLDKNTDSIPKLNIPKVKFAKINTETFYDKTNGIIRLVKDEPLRITKAPQDIAKELEDIRKENGLSFILDSSKEIPDKLKYFQSEDITKEFIIRYN